MSPLIAFSYFHFYFNDIRESNCHQKKDETYKKAKRLVDELVCK